MDDSPNLIKLADGTLIDPNNGRRVIDTAINRAFAREPISKGSSDVRFLPPRRYLDDLPVPGRQCNAVAVVASYAIFGLSDADIAHVVGVKVDTITQMRENDAFKQFLDLMLASVRNHDHDVVRRKLNHHALTATDALTGLLDSNDEKVKLNASLAVLDRSVGRPADIIEHRHRHEGGLTIRYVEVEDAPPSIDVSMDDG